MIEVLHGSHVYWGLLLYMCIFCCFFTCSMWIITLLEICVELFPIILQWMYIIIYIVYTYIYIFTYADKPGCWLDDHPLIVGGNIISIPLLVRHGNLSIPDTARLTEPPKAKEARNGKTRGFARKCSRKEVTFTCTAGQPYRSEVCFKDEIVLFGLMSTGQSGLRHVRFNPTWEVPIWPMQICMTGFSQQL